MTCVTLENLSKIWSAMPSDMSSPSATTIDDQKAALAKVGPTCMGCHALYRDGSKFKGM